MTQQGVPAALFQDHLTGLYNMQGWIQAHPRGVLESDGALVALACQGLHGIEHTYGAEASDAALCEVVARLQSLAPTEATLLRGDGAVLILWCPAVIHEPSVLAEHLQQQLNTEPIIFPDGSSMGVDVERAIVPVHAGVPCQEGLLALKQALVRQPVRVAAQDQDADSPLAVLNRQLAGMRLYGHERLIEDVLAQLKLPSLQPETVLVVGAPTVGKHRLLSCVAKYLEGHAPVAEVTCRPSDQAVPCSLLTALISRFLIAHNPQALLARLEPVMREHPWLASLFPLFRGSEPPPAPPEGQETLCRGLQGVLGHLVSAAPHIAIVHHLHQADAYSLQLLAALQGTSGQGLRLIADADETETALRPLLTTTPAIFPLPPLTLEVLAAYLREALPDIAQPEVVSALYAQSDGLPLLIESTLRYWASDGLLTLQEGRWTIDLSRVASETGVSGEEYRRFAQAALAGVSTVDFLAALWHTGEEEARATILRGRALGYFCPLDPHMPLQVACADPDQAAAMLQHLTPEQRTAAHAEIAALLEALPGREDERHPANLAYHLQHAGDLERAVQYLELVQLALPTLLSMMGSTPGLPAATANGWDVPSARPPTAQDITKIYTAAQAIRLVGVRFRYYPANSELVRDALSEAVKGLQALFDTRPSFTITCDGQSVAFDGQVLKKREEQLMMRDYLHWMGEANLQAIGLTPGITEQELADLLRTLGTFEPKDVDTPLFEVLQALALPHVKLLESSPAPLVQPGMQPGMQYPGWPMAGMPMSPSLPSAMPGLSFPSAPPATPNAFTASSPAPSPSAVAAGLSQISQFASSLFPAPAPMSMPGTSAPTTDAKHESALTGLLGHLNDTVTIDPEVWQKLPEALGKASTTIRRVMMTDLAQWLAKRDGADEQTFAESVDPLLLDRVAQEEDAGVLGETLTALEGRLQLFMTQGNLSGLVTALEALHQRMAHPSSPEVQTALQGCLTRLQARTEFDTLLIRAFQQSGNLDAARQLLTLLGERGAPLLLATLKQQTTPQVRTQALQLVREFGASVRPSLVAELRNSHPPQVLCLLLQAMADVGTRAVLGTVSEKMMHADPRVRAEALAAAVGIAKDAATPYLLRGLKDDSAEVRSRAASLAVFCIDPSLVPQLVRLLHPASFTRDEPESVQLAACLALGEFKGDAVRDALIQTVRPRLMPTLWRKSDHVRSAAITALANHIAHPAAQEAVRQAMQDRSLVVRQTAERVWQKHREAEGNRQIA